MFENNDTSEEILGIKGIPSSNLPCGVGFVIIPNNVDIKTYKEDVYRSGRVSIYGGYGHSNFYNILIDRDVLQRIVFPTETGKMGSPVVWINLPKHNEPIIIASLKYDEDFKSLSEFRSRTTRGTEGNLVDLDLDGKKGKASLNVVGNKNSKGELEITVNSVNNNGLLKLIVNGKILEKSSDTVIRISEKQMVNAVVNKKGIIVSKLELNSEAPERFYFEDEFGNKLTSSASGFTIDAKDGQQIFLDNSGAITINCGSNQIQISDSGINIDSGDKPITLNGQFEALYNMIPGTPITDVSQIGVSKKVKIG